MIDKLNEIEEKYNGINAQLSDPQVVSDMENYTALMKEYKTLTPVVDKFREYKQMLADAAESEQLLAEPQPDAEFAELLREELAAARQNVQQCEQQLKVLLLPHDDNDDKNVIIEIRGGAGGEEAALFAGDLHRMYTMYGDAKGWKNELLNANETELGGFKEVSFSISGEGAYSRLKYESGVHRVQRVPETETQGRIHTSTVTVAVLPEAEEVEVELNPKDLQIDTYRSSGAGGQHVNKTESAIRVTHLPTGLVVECQDERSQYKNKDRALKILRARLFEMKRREKEAEIAAERRSQVGTGDRSERIRTYNFPQGRVTDHRIGLTIYRLEAVLNGDMDEIIDALRTAEQAERLRAGE